MCHLHHTAVPLARLERVQTTGRFLILAAAQCTCAAVRTSGDGVVKSLVSRHQADARSAASLRTSRGHAWAQRKRSPSLRCCSPERNMSQGGTSSTRSPLRHLSMRQSGSVCTVSMCHCHHRTYQERTRHTLTLIPTRERNMPRRSTQSTRLSL